MIYIASPYSGTAEEQAHRFLAVREYTAKLIQAGHVAFSPIVYAHEMAKELQMGTDAKTWASFNDEMIRLSEGMHVLKLPGWTMSKGVKAEIDLAQRLDLPVTYVSYGFRNADH